MPKNTCVAISTEEQAQLLAALRRARSGYLLALHMVLLCAAGRTPTMIATVLFCSRASVSRTVQAYRAGTWGLEHDDQGRLVPPGRTTVLVPTLRRSRLALLKVPPRASGWGRTRWRCATRALTFQTTRGITISAETRRRWRHELGWGWQRAKRVAKDDAPQRVTRLARTRLVDEPWRLWETIVLADERDMQWLPKVGAAWMPTGTQGEVMTPGTNEKHSLAGALNLATGPVHHGVGPRQTKALFRALWHVWDPGSPATQDRRIDGVGDN